MTAQSERKELVPDNDSYAPQVKVIIGKQDVTENLIDDIISLRVTLQKDELGGFTMELANHYEVPLPTDTMKKDANRRFRHSDDDRLDVFEPITIEMGYEGRTSPLFVGEITMLQPGYPSSGVPTFTITGTDMLSRLRRDKPDEKKNKLFSNLADHEIAERIARRHNFKFSTESAKDSLHDKPVNQRDMDDLKFILYLAKRNDFECTVIIENNEPALYFGKPRDKRGSEPVKQLALSWGESLISFTPKLRVGSQVSKVTVRGWNSRKKEPFTYTAELKDLPKTGGNGTTGAEILKDKAGAKEERIVDRVVQSLDEAKRLAIQLLTETANEFLTGSGEAMGEPLIRPQVNLELGGLGRRYDGVYYVTKTDHVYGAAGYTTSFDVERLRDGRSPNK